MQLTRRSFGISSLAGALAACATPPPPEPEFKAETNYIIDLHCDTPMLIEEENYDLGVRHDYGQVDIPRMREGGVSAVFFSIYTSAGGKTEVQAAARALQIIAAVKQEVARHPNDLTLANSTAEIEQAKAENKIAILMGIEGGHMINSSLETLENLYRLGGRYMTLTHTQDTAWAGSSGGSPKGISDFGREVIKTMNRLGMMVDVSHVSDQTFFDVLGTSSAPVIASHSSCRSLANHPRNMSDEMLRALAQAGGVVHINFYNSFLSDELRAKVSELKDLTARTAAARKELGGDLKALNAALRALNQEQIEAVGRVPLATLLDHFSHAAEVCGPAHVGLGSDFDGVSDQLPEGMEDISKIPHLISGLRDRGFKDDEINQILGGNTMRVMRAAEAAAVE